MTPASFGRERVVVLRSRRVRDETGTFFVEGVRFLVTAVDSDAEIEALGVAPKLLRSPIGEMLARRLRARGVPALRVSPEEFAELSSAREL